MGEKEERNERSKGKKNRWRTKGNAAGRRFLSLLLFSVAFFSLLFPRTPFEKLFKSLSEKSGNYSPDR